MTRQRYWYLTVIELCPVCGSERRYRARVKRKPRQSIITKDRYDWCMEGSLFG